MRKSDLNMKRNYYIYIDITTAMDIIISDTPTMSSDNLSPKRGRPLKYHTEEERQLASTLARKKYRLNKRLARLEKQKEKEQLEKEKVVPKVENVQKVVPKVEKVQKVVPKVEIFKVDSNEQILRMLMSIIDLVEQPAEIKLSTISQLIHKLQCAQ